MNNLNETVVHISDYQYISLIEDSMLLYGEPEEIVEEIEQKHFNASFFVININYKADSICRSQSRGIEVLKLLRLKNYRQHCILYSFFPRDYFVEKNPKNLILYSPGVSFIQLPEDFRNWDIQTFLDKGEAPQDLSAYFRAESKLPDNRHFFANWWGVWQLWQIQRAVENIAGEEKADKIAQNFGKAYKEMNSYQGLLSRYLYGHRYHDIAQAIKAKQNERKEYADIDQNSISKIGNTIRDLNNQKAEKEKELKVYINLREQIEQRKTEHKQPLRKFLKSWLDREIDENKIIAENIAIIKDKIDTRNKAIRKNEYLLKLITEIEKEKERIYEAKRTYNDSLNRLIAQHTSLLNSLSYTEVVKQLQEERPSIVYVDDLADEGWAFIFKRMIYGKDYVGPAFKVIVPEKEDNVEHICKNIFQAVKDHYAKLLILDLRLKGEEGSITDPKKISGIQVLEKLNEMHLPCPVLITTASNKIWTYKHSLSSGAIRFWTKEGLDDKYDTNASVDNYLSFIYLVHTLCYNENVKFLYETFLPRIVEIEEYQSVFWWETTFWQEADGNYTKIEAGNKEKIVSILLETFNIYRDLVRIRIVEGNKLALNQSQVTAIISSLHRIVEHIYAVVIKPYKKSPSISDIIKTLTPERDFRDILHIRNKAVHESNISDIELSEYISAILTILQNRRDEYFEEEDRYFAASIELEQIAESCTAGTTLDNLGEAKAYGNESKLLESTIEPEDGKEYQTIVSSYDENKPELIFLQNPGLNLKWCKVNILLLRSNIIEGKEDVCVGARVLFKLKINKKRENYYASYAKIIKTDKK